MLAAQLQSLFGGPELLLLDAVGRDLKGAEEGEEREEEEEGAALLELTRDGALDVWCVAGTEAHAHTCCTRQLFGEQAVLQPTYRVTDTALRLCVHISILRKGVIHIPSGHYFLS